MDICSDLGITKANLKYYLGRYIKGTLSSKTVLDTIARIVLFRKLGCSHYIVKNLLCGDVLIYKDVVNKKKRKNGSQIALEQLQKTRLEDISYELCSQLLLDSDLVSRRLPWDMFGWGHIIDPWNVVFLVGFFLSGLLYSGNYDWSGCFSAILSGIVLTLIKCLIDMLFNWRNFRKIRKVFDSRGL